MLDRMTEYDYRCSWCYNKVILSVDHAVSLICPVCERRMLERVYPEDDELDEAFRELLEHRRD